MTEVFAYLLGIMTSLFAWRLQERRRRIMEVALEYIRIAPERAYADDFPRLRAFQKAGVALLKTESEVSAVREMVIQRGYRDPLKEWSVLESVGILRFFKEANLRDVPLDDMGAVIGLVFPRGETDASPPASGPTVL